MPKNAIILPMIFLGRSESGGALRRQGQPHCHSLKLFGGKGESVPVSRQAVERK
ncbi:MAG: hypothetical protein K9N62_12530 [Verrucomicrobia bacterium]|nr:hypothetical protein [Verrucomicrobiota bacterium]